MNSILQTPSLTRTSSSPEETFSLGQSIAPFLSPGSVVALKGELGSGKTCLAKGIASGLGIKDVLTSPTYTIINEYREKEDSPVTGGAASAGSYAARALFHIDAYRLENDKDFEDIGGPEIINGNGISIIEWSDRIPNSLPDDKISISLEITGPSSRSIRIKGLELVETQ